MLKGEAEGLAEGVAKAKMDMAKSFMQLNVLMATVMAATGLSEEEVLAIKALVISGPSGICASSGCRYCSYLANRNRPSKLMGTIRATLLAGYLSGKKPVLAGARSPNVRD